MISSSLFFFCFFSFPSLSSSLLFLLYYYYHIRSFRLVFFFLSFIRTSFSININEKRKNNFFSIKPIENENKKMNSREKTTTNYNRYIVAISLRFVSSFEIDIQFCYFLFSQASLVRWFAFVTRLE